LYLKEVFINQIYETMIMLQSHWIIL